MRQATYDRGKLIDLATEARSRYSTTQEAVLEALRVAVNDGVLPAGSRLRQEDLADVFGTSRIPVREALRVLEYEGLVNSQAHRGFAVRGITAHEIEEIYELRTLLETHAIRIAIPLLTDDDIEDLSELFERATSTEDHDLSLQLRDDFFIRLYSVTARPRLVALIARLRQEVARSLRWKHVQHSHGHHAILFEAVKNGDVELAIAELTAHHRKISMKLQRYVREWELSQAAVR